ncbi:hypothetical protein ACLOJK_000546 [Asimina triloba]
MGSSPAYVCSQELPNIRKTPNRAESFPGIHATPVIKKRPFPMPGGLESSSSVLAAAAENTHTPVTNASPISLD